MDETQAVVQRFQEQLDQFNQRLAQSVNEINGLHQKVNALWNDSMRRDYDQRFEPLKESLEAYVKQVGPTYVSQLQYKCQAMQRYLHGY